MNPSTPPDKLIVANCSGFFGDRFTAAKEMVEGGPIDVLTGDYLAEPTSRRAPPCECRWDGHLQPAPVTTVAMPIWAYGPKLRQLMLF
jgi:hypothetical protein